MFLLHMMKHVVNNITRVLPRHNNLHNSCKILFMLETRRSVERVRDVS